MNGKESIISEKLLLVEGRDEKSFFTALFGFLKIDNVDIKDVGGCLKFSSYYQTVSALPGFSDVKKIGFVRDAEINPAKSAFDSICNTIKKITPNVSLPQHPGIVVNGKVSCGIFIMPDNKSAGMLEDLCIESVRNSQLFENADNYIKVATLLLNAEEQKSYNIHKAKVQAFLAGKSNIPRNLGEAASKKVWDFSNPVFSDVISFVKQLFKEE